MNQSPVSSNTVFTQLVHKMAAKRKQKSLLNATYSMKRLLIRTSKAILKPPTSIPAFAAWFLFTLCSEPFLITCKQYSGWFQIVAFPDSVRSNSPSYFQDCMTDVSQGRSPASVKRVPGAGHGVSHPTLIAGRSILMLEQILQQTPEALARAVSVGLNSIMSDSASHLLHRL